jgi:hypothetical protein
MKPLFPYPFKIGTCSLKVGLAAFGLMAGLSVPAVSGPMPQPAPIAPAAATSAEIIPVSDSSTGRHMNDFVWRRHWRGGNGWHGGWHGGRHWGGGYYRHRHWYGGGSGIYLGLGGFGLGAPFYDPYYEPYYDPYYYDYYYYRPHYRVYYPRRVYRGTSAHVRWCYAHYRSYRASDNTFQPNHGPRRQCRAPY